MTTIDLTSDMTAHPAQRRTPRVSKAANIINLVMIVASLALLGLVLGDVHGDLRLWLTVAVFVLGPGSGVVQFFRLPTAALQIGILMALSVSFDIILSEGLLSIHNISGNAAICLIAGVTCIRPLHLTAGSKVTR
jgi:hypothetical protein